MFNIKATIDSNRIEKKIKQIIEKYELNENKVKLFFDYDTMIIDILYEENTLIDTINITNYLNVEIARI